MSNIAVTELKEYRFSRETFEDLRLTDYGALKNDIAQHGIKTALHVLPDNTVICGHQRLRAAKELGLTTVPCEIKELKNDTEIREWAVKDNLLRRQLTPEQRYLLIAELSKIYQIGRGAFGRGRPKLEEDTVSSSNVLERTAQEVGETPKTIQRARAYAQAVETYPELRKMGSVISAVGECQRRKSLQQRTEKAKAGPTLKNLICGDALEAVKKFGDCSIDCVVMDPPYGIEFHAASARWLNRTVTGDTPSIFPYMGALAPELYRVMKKDSDLYCFCGWKDSYTNFFKAFQDAGFGISNCIVWKKNQRTTGPDFKKRYALFHEFIIYAKKGGRYLSNPFSPDVMVFDKLRDADSPVQKPTELLKFLIKNSTVEGEVVLDPFAGTGSTLVAAEELGRSWIGNEIDPHWHGVAKARILEVQK